MENFYDVMSELEAMGTAQNRKIYIRHGAREPMFGVSFANLAKLKKRIKGDHQMAIQLWETKNVDARTLATLIADPDQTSESMLDSWGGDTDYDNLVDVFVKNLGKFKLVSE